MKYYIFILMVLLSFDVRSQDILKNNFFEVELSSESNAEKMNDTVGEDSSADLYKVSDAQSNKLKYLISLLSNKLTVELKEIEDFNLDDYLSDLGKVELVKYSKVESGRKGYKLFLKMERNVYGILYMTFKADNLVRILFMLPEDKIPSYSDEFDKIYNSLKIN